MFWKFLVIFFVSMLPLVELRGSIPIAAGMDLPILPSLIVAMVGNMALMPLVFIFARDLLEAGLKRKHFKKFCKWCIEKGNHASEKLHAQKSASIYLALVLFIGIPFPGTGAWSGTIGASFLNLNFKKSMMAIAGGTLLSGLIMLAVSFGAIKLLL